MKMLTDKRFWETFVFMLLTIALVGIGCVAAFYLFALFLHVMALVIHPTIGLMILTILGIIFGLAAKAYEETADQVEVSNDSN